MDASSLYLVSVQHAGATMLAVPKDGNSDCAYVLEKKSFRET
jgi:hypothetical protein